MPIKGEKKCPRCGQDFEKREGEKCPNCKVTLKFQRGKKDGVFQFWYEIEDTEMAKPVSPLTTQKLPEVRSGLSNNYPRTLSQPMEDPQVIQTGPSSYEVSYQMVMTHMMAYCPKCNRPAFQINILKGELEHQCTAFVKEIQGKCLAKTTYVFLSSHLTNR